MICSGSIIPGIGPAGPAAGAASATLFEEPRASFGSLVDLEADSSAGAGSATDFEDARSLRGASRGFDDE